MSSYAIHVIILLTSVLISATSQIILKISANKKYDSFIKEYLNPYVITAYSMFLVSTVLTMIALRVLPLSHQQLLESVSYIFVSVMGYFILKERFTKKKLLGMALILIGIFIFAI